MNRDPLPASDPFLFDAEQLQSLASPPIVRRGIAYFKEGRVTDLGWNAERLWASVEGTLPAPYQVEVSLDSEGELAIDCDCPFDWEPACKHVVATLLSYGARQPVSRIQVEDAASAAVEARIQRGRAEVAVKHVAGDLWLGTWEARSLDSAAEGRAPWRVELRSLSERINHCSCPDFATNRLGTCKHVEAVLHKLRKRAPRKAAQIAADGPPLSLVHLDWEGPEAPRARLRPAAGGAPEWLDSHFDQTGLLRGALPEAFYALQRAARARRTLMITPEVEQHVQRLVEETDRRRRGAALAASIRSSGGRLPAVKARLYPYQVEGVAFLAAAGRALLADDMGLGKTLQAIAAAAILHESEGVRRTLVVCPTSLKHQWAREVQRFTGLEGVVVEGGPAARLARYRRHAPFTIVNYEILLRDGEVLQRELAPDLLIADEAQRIKNWRTKAAAAIKSLETRYAFVLTGTPLENRLEDLYSLMQLVDPRVLGPLWRYLLDFHVVDPQGKVLGYRNLGELRRRLAPVMLRRDRSLVRDQLPERIDNRLDVELDRRQRDLHDEALAAAARFGQIAQKRPLTPAEEKRLMAALQTARMACDAAGLVDKETVGSPKLAELASLFEELCVGGGRKVVVFSQWERMTHMAEEVAHGLGLGTVRLHGGVPSSRRSQLIDRFRDDPAVQVFLSTDAGGVGLNLQAASVLVNLDLPWNPAVLEQRIARIHRLGQSEPVQVVLMVARDSYEERLAVLLESKRALFHNVVAEDASEDVVGVSRRMLDVALASLEEDTESSARGEASARGKEEVESAPPASDAKEEPEATAGPQPRGAAPTLTDESLASLVARLQASLTGRIERVTALGGGLVVVVDSVDSAAEELAQAASEEVPVAVVDARTWAALSRLGASGPPADERPLFAAPSAPAAAASRAERKLAAALVLAEQGHGSEALSLATSAMLHAAATAAGLSMPPPPERFAVWLHAELVPRGVVGFEDAGCISRGLALANTPELPPELVASVLADAQRLTRSLAL
jgi:hypothetical protein